MLTIPDQARWNKLKDILADALEQSSAQARTETLRQACAGDAELLQDAQRLMEQDTTSLEHFAEEAAIWFRDDLPDRAGERLGAYAITRELGRGGMGAVYLGQRADGQFEKKVAIKILKRGTDTDEVLRRFRAERQILANLEHPHITRLLDAGVTHDNLPYVVMEFVDGKSITEFVRERKCTLAERLELFLKVCSAVELAHKKGVVHRDIKPSNVLVTEEGEVKLLDFGIAKVLAGEGEDVTVALERRLTPKYAAPEQKTDQTPTAATDIYSLGTLLSELLEQLPQIDAAADRTKQCLKKVVERSTYPGPAKRYHSAGELAEAVKACLGESTRLTIPSSFNRKRVVVILGAALILFSAIVAGLLWQKRDTVSKRDSAVAPVISDKIRSIAILPFEPLSRDKDELLGLGMADAIIGRLSGLKQLVVLPTAAVSRFRGQGEDAISAGKKLNVDAVLNGTVQQNQGRIRVTVQLVNVGSRRTLWAETFDQTSTDIFELQDSISGKVARSLLVNLSESERQQLEKHPTGDTAAYDLYLLGVSVYNTRTKEGLQQAIDYFKKAITSDPHYALAYALMSDCYYLLSYYNYESSTVALPRARAAAEKALALDSSLPEAQLAISTMQRMDTPDSAGSPGIQSLLRAIRLNPNYALAHQRYAWYLCGSGQLEQGVPEMRKALELDPLSSTNNTALGIMLIFARRYDEGLHYCQRAAELNPNEPFIQGNLAAAYLLQHRYDEAIAAFRRIEQLVPSQHGDSLVQITKALFDAGRTSEAEKLMPEVLELAKQKKADPYNLALLYVSGGEMEQALIYLNQPESMGFFSPGLLRYDPQLDPIRSDPRFQEFLLKAEREMPRR